jgi:CHAT domain-containing protein
LVERGWRAGTASRSAWRELGTHFIGPVERWLPPVGGRLTIVPHGVLTQVPFAALVDASGRYLVERFEIHHLPAAAAAQGESQSSVEKRYLLVGNPRGLSGLPPLPGSRAELTGIAARLPKASVLTLAAAEARREAVVTALDGPAVAHFATHAVLDSEHPMNSYLALSDGDRLTAGEIYDLRLAADLVVLTACRSAAGRISSDGALGLTRAFFSAGVEAVVSAVWDTADQTAPVLAGVFYREYARGASAAPALRKAQLDLLARLRKGTFELDTPAGKAVVQEHPLLWATLVVHGRP